MVTREAEPLARTLAREFKVVAIVGPRQSGKTTLAKALFSAKPYASLEDPDLLRFAQEDPRGFLGQYPGGAVIDEAQRCPELFSYLQGVVDRNREPGQFVLTGSQHFGLVQRITQSLAGRVGFVNLLPFSGPELLAGGWLPASLDAALLHGGYPPVFDMPASPERWYNAYLATYIERDVRQLRNVQDLPTFQRVLRLCAGSVGQLADLTRIGNDAGVDQKTVRAWLGVLEASFILFRLQPHHRSFRKRLVKTPKLYFYDVGVAARLIGIESAEQMNTHPLRGALFENWVIVEHLKRRWNAGKESNLFFWAQPRRPGGRPGARAGTGADPGRDQVRRHRIPRLAASAAPLARLGGAMPPVTPLSCTAATTRNSVATPTSSPGGSSRACRAALDGIGHDRPNRGDLDVVLATCDGTKPSSRTRCAA